MCMLTIYNIYFDILTIEITRKNEKQAIKEDNESLAHSLKIIRVF